MRNSSAVPARFCGLMPGSRCESSALQFSRLAAKHQSGQPLTLTDTCSDLAYLMGSSGGVERCSCCMIVYDRSDPLIFTATV